MANLCCQPCSVAGERYDLICLGQMLANESNLPLAGWLKERFSLPQALLPFFLEQEGSCYLLEKVKPLLFAQGQNRWLRPLFGQTEGELLWEAACFLTKKSGGIQGIEEKQTAVPIKTELMFALCDLAGDGCLEQRVRSALLFTAKELTEGALSKEGGLFSLLEESLEELSSYQKQIPKEEEVQQQYLASLGESLPLLEGWESLFQREEIPCLVGVSALHPQAEMVCALPDGAGLIVGKNWKGWQTRKAPLEQVAAALASKIRLEILSCLANEPMSAVALSKEVNLSFSKLSYHLTLLMEAGLILEEGEGRGRKYRPSSKGLASFFEGLEQLVSAKDSSGEKK